MDTTGYPILGAPQAPEPPAPPAPPAEATPQIVAPVVPPPSDQLVTLPSDAGPGQEQDVFEVPADGEVHKLTREEVLRAASGGLHFERQMETLKPAKEMREFVEAHPGVEDAISYLMKNGVPQELGYGEQPAAPYAPQQAPQQQQFDQTAQFLMQQVAGVQADLQRRDFQTKFPDADLAKVSSYMQEHDIGDPEIAYKAMAFDQVQAAGSVAQQQNAQQRQATALEPGAQGAPQQKTVNPHELSNEQKSKIGAQYYNLLE